MSSNPGNNDPAEQNRSNFEQILKNIKRENVDQTPAINSQMPIQEPISFSSASVTSDTSPVQMQSYQIKTEDPILINDNESVYNQANSMHGGTNPPVNVLQDSEIKTEMENFTNIYKCKCGATFCDEFLHFGHVLDHMLKFLCKVCGLMFDTEVAVQSHIMNKHVASCKFCKNLVAHKQLNRHNYLYHPNQARHQRMLYEKRRKERRNQFQRDIAGWVFQISEWRLAIDNHYRNLIPSNKEKAVKKYWKNPFATTGPVVKTEPNNNVQFEPNANVKIEPGSGHVKTEPMLKCNNVKMEQK